MLKGWVWNLYDQLFDGHLKATQRLEVKFGGPAVPDTEVWSQEFQCKCRIALHEKDMLIPLLGLQTMKWPSKNHD